MSPATLRETLLHAARGFCMGAADVVPGVSGGTMAFVLGIYQRLLEAIRSFDAALLGHLGRRRITSAARHVDLGFLAPLGLGILAALVFFTRVVPLPTLIRTHPELVYALFFGLIVGSIVVLLRSMPRIDAAGLGFLAAGAVVGFAIVNLVPVATPEAAWFVFVSGALAISAMLLPGISGSFILLILRKYEYVFGAIGRFDLAVLVPFGLGVVAGLMLFSRLLSWLLRRWHRPALLAICGVLVGSLWVIWPFQTRVYEMVRGEERLLSSRPVWPEAIDGGLLAPVALAALGLAAVLALQSLVSRRAPKPGA